MTATSKLTSAEIKAKLATFEALLAESKSQVPAALRGTAGEDGAGEIAYGINTLRSQIQSQTDVVEGLRLLLGDTELEELNAEIERREAGYEREATRLEKLRVGATRDLREQAGTGAEFRAAQRADQADRDAAWTLYENANVAHIDERKALDGLIRRRDELARQVAA